MSWKFRDDICGVHELSCWQKQTHKVSLPQTDTISNVCSVNTITHVVITHRWAALRGAGGKMQQLSKTEEAVSDRHSVFVDRTRAQTNYWPSDSDYRDIASAIRHCRRTIHTTAGACRRETRYTSGRRLSNTADDTLLSSSGTLCMCIPKVHMAESLRCFRTASIYRNSLSKYNTAVNTSSHVSINGKLKGNKYETYYGPEIGSIVN